MSFRLLASRCRLLFTCSQVHLPVFNMHGSKFHSTTSNLKSAGIVVPRNYNFVRDHMDILAAEENNNGKKLAFWWVDNAGNELKYSYTELSDASKRVANGLLKNCGLKSGDRIFLLLPRVSEWWILILACIRSGILPIPATIMLSDKDITYRLNTAEPKIIFTIPELAHKVDKAILASSNQCLKILCPQATSKMASVDGWANFETVTKGVDANHNCVLSATDDTMMIYFTSGTTGMPKMVDLTHGCALGHRHSTTPFFASEPEKPTFVYADPGWVAALYGGFFPPWYNRSTVFSYYVPPSPPVWSQLFDILKKYSIHTFLAPPTVYRMLLQEKLPRPDDLPDLKNCLTGGEPLNGETFIEWKKRMGHDIRELYGQTETPGIIGNALGSIIKPGSFGKALGKFDIRVLDENMTEVPPKVEGNIAIKCGNMRPYIFKQYIDNPKKTAKVYQKDFYVTGDRGFKDEDGYFHFSSRSDDVMITSGYRIGPFEVESAILAHPAVIESAAVSSPDKDRGEIIKAFVVLKEEYRNHDTTKLAVEIQETVKKVTAPYKYPRKVEFVNELPKTISGKVKRADLRQREWAHHKS